MPTEQPRENIQGYQRRVYSRLGKVLLIIVPAILFIWLIYMPDYSTSSVRESALPYLILVTISVVVGGIGHVLFTVREIFHPKARIGWPLYELSAFALSSIVVYAIDYRFLGIKPTITQDPVSPWDNLYFSIITWTTVGYGDFVPTPTARLFAASEALLGYLFMGMYLATLFQVLVITAPRVWGDADKRVEAPLTEPTSRRLRPPRKKETFNRSRALNRKEEHGGRGSGPAARC
jgi:hypothetical protein